MSAAFEGVEKLDPETKGALRRLILSLADTKRILGIRYSDWLLGAPSIEAGIAASSMAQDEWGHARLVYSLLKDLDEDPLEVEHERPAQQYCSVDPLDEPFEDWADFIAAVVVIDGALSTALEGLSDTPYETLAGRVPKILAEEEFHQDFGRAWFRRITEAGGEGRQRLAARAQTILPRTLAALFPEDDAHQRLVEAGLATDGATLRSRFAEAVNGLLEPLGLEVDASAQAVEWDAERSRGPGYPGEEAVERARGDRNRALFVE